MVPALRFDRTRIQAFLALAGERLDGEWLVIGGAAAAAWFVPSRTTEDIDMIGLAGTRDERFALMTLASEAAVPIEAVNSAADFFVRRIDGWRDHLVSLHRGSRATIYRPDATLFLQLKVPRLSEVDLADCLALLALRDEVIERPRVLHSLASLADTEDAALRDRRARLAMALGV